MQIAFSGRLGSGKSTVCAILRDKFGFEIYSTGKVQRKVAEEMGISTLELNELMSKNPELDHKIDDAVVALSREKAGEKIVYDSRMAWHFAENTFKVYMYVDPYTAAKRVFAADRGDVEKYSSVEDAAAKLYARSVEENTRFKRIYGVDNFDYANYNLIIDSTTATPEQIADEIASAAEDFEKNPYLGTKMKLSPYVIIPTKPYGTEDGDEISIAVIDGKNYCVGGHSLLSALQLGSSAFAQAYLTEERGISPDKSLIAEYEAAADFKYPSLG